MRPPELVPTILPNQNVQLARRSWEETERSLQATECLELDHTSNPTPINTKKTNICSNGFQMCRESTRVFTT